MSTWKWNRYNANMAKTIPSKVDDATIPNRIDCILNNGAVTDADKAFISSLKNGWDKYKSLTTNQYAAFQRVESKYDPANLAVTLKTNVDWQNNFDVNKRGILNICANYYIKTVYFRDIAEKVLKDPNWIPTEKQYRAMCENKYAQRLIENIQTPAKYPIGSLVSIRSTYGYHQEENNVAVVLTIGDANDTGRGCRQYKLMFVGSDETKEYFERDIKRYREPK